MTEAIERVGVIGAGQMGAGIAEVCARAGVHVAVYEPTEALTTAGRNRIVKSLERGVSAGKVTERERAAAWQERYLGAAPVGNPADQCAMEPQWRTEPLALGATAACFSVAFFILAYGYRPPR